MKNLKKVLALVVVFAMMMSTVAFASYPDVDTTADYAGAVELLSALNVLKGDDQGNFNPDNTITRAEFAAVVCRALGLENSANSAKGATMFNDVAADHWATGYINLASQQGIINGKGNGIFDPEGNVTFAEAVKMLVVAIGYEPMAAQRGGYPTGYLTVANSTKMTAGVSASGTDAAALRSTVAMLTANAMEIPVMDQTGYGTEVTFEVLDDYDNYSTLLTNQDIYTLTGVVGDTDEDNDTIVVTLSEASDDYEFGYNSKGDVLNDVENGKYTKTLNIADSNIEAYYQQNVKIYVYKAAKNDYDVLIAVPSGIGETLTIKGSDLNTNAAVVGNEKVVVEYYETPEATKATKIYTSDKAQVYLNGSAIDLKDLASFATVDSEIEFVENTDDKYYDIVLVTVYENAIVEEVDAEDPENSRIKFLGNKKVNLDFEDDDKIIELVDAEGNAIELADFAENDVVAMVVGDTLATTATEPVDAKNFKDKIKIINLGESSVTGTVTESSDEYIYIDGTEYEVGDFVDGNYGDVFDAHDVAKLGTEGMFFISATGKIIGFDGTAGGNTNYGYILQTNYDDSGFNAGWEIKMLTKEGIATYGLYTTVNLDGTSVKAETLGKTAAEFAGLTTKNDHKNNVAGRVVEYKLTADGKIKNLTFVGATVVNKDEFSESSYKINGNTLADDVVIFDIEAPDADDAKAYDISYLIDEGEYAGFVAAKDDEWDVFVMTEGSAKFDAEAGLMYVESVKSSTYGADDAVTVNYYTDGDNTVKSAIFVYTEALQVAGKKGNNGGFVADYNDLSKGDIFVANLNAEGLVSEYAIVAKMSNKSLVLDTDTIAYLENADEDVAFLFGYVKDIDKKGNVTLTEDYITSGAKVNGFKTSSANEYHFNAKVKKPTVEVSGWDNNGVDVAEDGVCYYVFAKFFDGDAVDVYGIGYEMAIPSNNGGNNNGGNNNAGNENAGNENAGNENATPSAVEEVVEVEEVEELVFE